jgi:hypothetical protein
MHVSAAGRGVQHNQTNCLPDCPRLPDMEQIIAAFLLARGDFAWMGAYMRNKNATFTFNDTKPFCVKGKVEKKTGAFFCAGYEYNGCADAMSKNGLFEPFIYKNEHFTKTVAGQIWGTHSITRPSFI